MFKNLKGIFSPSTKDNTNASANAGEWPTSNDGNDSAGFAVPVSESSSAPTPATLVTQSIAASSSEVAANGKAPADDAILDSPLPETLSAALAFHRDVQALTDRNDPVWKEKRHKKERAARFHVDALGRKEPATHSLKGHGSHHKRVIAVVCEKNALAISNLKAKVDSYKALRKKLNDEGLLPGSAVAQLEMIEKEIAIAPDKDAIDALIARKALLTEYKKNYNLGVNSVRQLNLLVMGIKSEVEVLALVIDLTLSHQEKLAVELEQDFFAQHELLHEQTQLSRIYGVVRGHIARTFENYHRALKFHENGSPTALITFDPSNFSELFE